ncbi:glycosyltransferase family 2 protein, partial [Clavibacter michiganensis subsp. insidiosus]
MLVGRYVARPRLHPDARPGRLLRLGDRTSSPRPAAATRPATPVR